MKKSLTSKHHIRNNCLFLTGIMVLSIACLASLPQSAHADPLTPPEVPTDLRVPAGNHVFLKGYAVGTQQYVCLKPGTSAPWTQFGPQATLFKDNGKQNLTHFLSSNPLENPDHPVETGKARPTWQDSKDSSAVWAAPVPGAAVSVSPDAIPWLLLKVVGAQEGPTGGDNLTATTFIHRLNTTKGLAPSTGCAVATDIGKKVLVPYTADYYFYTNVDDDADDRN